MTYNFTISPDFGPERLAGWYVFNTWLQRVLDVGMHLEIYSNFNSQREAIQADKVDLIYANPYDASMLVREKGFAPLVKPRGKCDEAIIAVSASQAASVVEDLSLGIIVATTDDPDVHMMGMIMLEPAGLNTNNISLKICDSYVLVAKQLLKGEAAAGIFLAEAFNNLSSVVRSQLKILVRSEIQVVHHSLMLGPALSSYKDRLRDALLSMSQDPKGCGVLTSLGFERWEHVDEEEMEFMIDLMDTLLV